MSVAVPAPSRGLAHGRLTLVHERRRVASRVLAVAPWALLGLFLAAELAVSALEIRGPFLDEGIYIAAGLRTLQGHGITDNYTAWFSGSLLWPVIAALGWKTLGLAGARAAAALCVTAGLLGTLKAAGNLFGLRVRAATALAAVTSGPVIALGHLAVYDTLAVGAAGCAFWTITEFIRCDDRSWLCATALLYALAGLAKYPVLLFIGPPLVGLLLATRQSRARMDIGLFGFIAGAVLLVYFLADRSQLAAFEAFRTNENPNFHVSRDQIAYSQVYLTAVPLVLAVAGATLLERRRIAFALMSGVAGAPVYHLVTGNPSGDQKHVVFGLLFMLPLIGVTLSLALRHRRALLAVPALLGLLVFGGIQVVRIDEGWPDLRGSAAVLVKDVRPGERLLANSSWVEAAYLYDHGRITSPYDVFDASRVARLHGLDVCSFQWFVEVPGGDPWPQSIRSAMSRCGTFRRIYSSKLGDHRPGQQPQLRHLSGADRNLAQHGAAALRRRRRPREGRGMSISTIHHDRRAQAASLFLLAAMAWFLPWLFAHADISKAWVSVPFLTATVIVCLASVVSIVNRWHRATPVPAPVPDGEEPRVAVIVPTLGEPLTLLERTIRSVLDQDWPAEKLWILISDDGCDNRVRRLVRSLALEFPDTTLGYHRPPQFGDPARKGEAKAGNLNSALGLLPDDIEFVETRDADDLVGDQRFLRETVGHLMLRSSVAFVQTAKAGEVSPHDPFDNQQPHFFHCAMLSRYAANAVFPCGSGVVWRRAALHEIGDFPTWNLVEDLQSGLEALRRGWEGCYLPILGAYAQHSPEDLPNFVKQRGTWALDTVRLTLWAPKSGLSLRQRLQFYELGLFYMQGPATLVFLLAPILGFTLHWYPVVTSTNGFILHFWPFAAGLELYLALVHRPMSLEQLWRARLVWAGLCFVYARACVLAILGGRNGKPRYRVTRKENVYAWHWRQIVPHVLLLGVLFGAMAFSLAEHGLLNSFDVGSAYWAVLYGLLMVGFIRLSWHGIEPLRRGRLGSPDGSRAREGGEWIGPPSPVRRLARGNPAPDAVRALELRIAEWSARTAEPVGAQAAPEPGSMRARTAAEG